jgi:hypothetical protein
MARPARAVWPWNSVYTRFANRSKKGRWELIFKALQLELDEVGSIVDGSVVRARQDASGGKGGSRAMPSVVLAEVFDQTPRHRRCEGRPIYVAITPGQRHEMMKADELLAHAPGKARKKRAVIGSKPERPRKLPKSRALFWGAPSASAKTGSASECRADRA